MDTTHNASSTNSILINTLKCCLTYLFNCLSGTRCHKQFSSVILCLFLSPVLKLFVQLGFHWTLIRLAVSGSEVTTVIWRYRNAIIIIIIMLFTDFLTISSRITVLPNTFTRYVYKIVGTAQLYVPSVQPVPQIGSVPLFFCVRQPQRHLACGGRCPRPRFHVVIRAMR